MCQDVCVGAEQYIRVETSCAVGVEAIVDGAIVLNLMVVGVDDEAIVLQAIRVCS